MRALRVSFMLALAALVADPARLAAQTIADSSRDRRAWTAQEISDACNHKPAARMRLYGCSPDAFIGRRGQPLYIVDGRPLPVDTAGPGRREREAVLGVLRPADMAEVTPITGDSAVARFGPAARFGAVVIRMKRAAPPTSRVQDTTVMRLAGCYEPLPAPDSAAGYTHVPRVIRLDPREDPIARGHGQRAAHVARRDSAQVLPAMRVEAMPPSIWPDHAALQRERAATRDSLLAELAAARARWAAHGDVRLTYRLEERCFCLRVPALPEYVIVRAVGDSVLDVRDQRGERARPLYPHAGDPSVPFLFARADSAIRGADDAITVTFDRELGVPTRVFEDRMAGATDDELDIVVSRIAVDTALDTTPDDSATVRAVRAASRELDRALERGDTGAVARLYADAYVHVDQYGRRSGRTERLAELARGTRRVVAMPEPEDERFAIAGDVVVATARTAGRQVVNGRAVADGVRLGTRVWVRRDGRWQVLLAQATPVTAP